jgi:hypothetical protein
MKLGRAHNHIHCKWISITQNYIETYYQLDENGKPIHIRDCLLPSKIHHNTSFVINDPFGDTTIQEQPLKNTKIQIPKQPIFFGPKTKEEFEFEFKIELPPTIEPFKDLF